MNNGNNGNNGHPGFYGPQGYTPPQAPQGPQGPQGYAPPGYAPPPAYGAPPQGYMPPQAPPQGYTPPQGPQGYAPPGLMPPQAPQGFGAPPPALDDGALAGLNGAQVYESGSYFPIESAEMDCKVSDVILKQSQASGAVVIIEHEVIRTSGGSTPVGSKRGVVIKLSNRQVAFPQLLEFAAAVLGYDKSNPAHMVEINTKVSAGLEAVIKEACRAKTMNGKMVHVSTIPHVTKKNQKQIAKINWSPFRG